MSNYEAIVAKIDSVLPIPNADNIQIGKVLGETVIIGKDIEVGTIGIFFCAGTQLSDNYCKFNNLYRDTSKNSRATAKAGFFDDNRRVRAQPFLKVKSEGLFMPLNSLEFAGLHFLQLGDKFESLGGVQICNKYVNPKTKEAQGNSATKAAKKDLTPHFKEHVETGQYRYNTHLLQVGDLISFQSKKHGTSGRYAYTKVITPDVPAKTFWQKVVSIFKSEKVEQPESQYEYVAGTRRTVLKNENQEGFHGSEGYRFEILEQLKPYLTKGMEIYVEIVGYVNGRPIMPVHSTKDLKDKAISKKYGDEVVYKYGCVQGEYKFHIYRITLTTEDGNAIDFTQKQLVQWCNDRGLDPAYDVVPAIVYDGNLEALNALVDELTERPHLLTEDYHDQSHVSEGIIVRVDRGTQTPLFLKSKSYVFKVMEGIASEKEVDTEDAS